MTSNLKRTIALVFTLACVQAARAQKSAPPPAPPAQPVATPTIDEIVQRASAQMGHKPEKLVCVVNLKAVQLDSDGKPTETQEAELSATWSHGVEEEGLPYKRSVDGKPYTAEEMKKADDEDRLKHAEMKAHENQGEGSSMDSPLLGAQVARHSFALLRSETVDGRLAYVISVKPLKARRDDAALTREGTIWIDAQSYLPFHAQTHASPFPRHVDKMDVDERFTLTAQGETAPQALLLDVSGGFFLFHRAYKLETRWHDCK